MSTVNDERKKAWKHSITKNKSNASKLETLPPTDEAFSENLKRGHLKIAVWRCSLSAVPPIVDIYLHGWGKEGQTKYVVPITVSQDVHLVPDEILKIFRCGCASENSCISGNCSCNKSRLPCSMFCECEGGISCRNPFNAKVDNEDDGVEKVVREQ